MGKVVSYQRESKPLPHELLLMYRQRSGLTQTQLATQLGLKSDRMVQKWEGGYTLPTAPRLQSLIQLYLYAGVFIAGNEQEETHQLWSAIKDMFDQNTATYESYPIFDEGWFGQLTLDRQPSGAVLPITPALNAPSTLNFLANPRPIPKASPFRSGSSQLPVPPNRLIGREVEIKAIQALLRKDSQGQRPVRLLTLTGSGGTGKTRLAIQIASEMQSEFERVWFVSLASIQNPNLVEFTIAQALGLSEKSGALNLELIQRNLAGKQALLVLDNFEHLLAAIPLVKALLESCPDLVVLVTSRIALRLSWEQEFPVVPLKLPPFSPGKTLSVFPNLLSTRQYSAVALFLERAQAVKPSFDLEEANSAAIIEICQHLDGLPLALELAAAWVKMLSPQNLLSRLIDNNKQLKLQMLAMSEIDQPERHKTIWASINWSYSLLNQAEQILLRRLAIFSEGWELVAAEEICAGDGLEQSAIVELLYHLINYSLVVVDDPPTDPTIYSEPRFRLLETIRQYSWEKLQEAGKLEGLCDRYLEYYVKMAEDAEAGLFSPQEKHWKIRLTSEINNIRVALKWGLETNTISSRECVLRIASALRWYWMQYSLAEGRRWLEKGLENLPVQLVDEPNLWRAKGLIRVAHLAINQGDYRQIRERCAESLKLCCALNYPGGVAESLRWLSDALVSAGELNNAMSVAKESLEVARSIGNKLLQASATHQLGKINYALKNYFQARLYQEQALRLWQECGVGSAQAQVLLNLAIVVMAQGDYAEATKIFKECLKLCQKVEDFWSLVGALAFGLTRLLLLEGKVEQSVIFLGLIETLREQIGWKEVYEESKDYLETIQAARSLLGEESFSKLYERGRQMSPEQAMAVWEQT